MGANVHLLEMNHVSKTFPGVKALVDVSISLEKGEVLAIVGENGAGKSTMMNILSGQYTMDSGQGEILIEGVVKTYSNPLGAIKNGIAMIYQELNPILGMDIASNIFLHREQMHPHTPFVARKRIEKQAQELLDRFGIKRPASTLMSKLSVAEMQMIEIIKAVSYDAKILVMDEPSSSLTEDEAQLLFGTIRELRESGVGIIYISHRMEEIFELADRVAVFRDGRVVGTHDVADVTQDTVITEMVGHQLEKMFPKVQAEIGDDLLRINGFTRKGIFDDISFSVKRGEILGLSGLVGAGRSEIVKALFGLDPYDKGEIFLEGKKVRFRSPRQAIDAGVAMVSEDRRQYGLVLCRNIRENTSIAHMKLFRRGPFINHREEHRRVQGIVDSLSLRHKSLAQRTSTLSGGNQQKVVIAKWLIEQPKVIILDEPTRGIDVGAKAAIHQIISELAAKGMAVIMISSELPEILGMSDRIIVIGEGKIRAEFAREEATQERILAAAFKSR